jgi:undecaprenyl diphosphate synthase
MVTTLDPKLRAQVERAERWPVLEPPVPRDRVPRHIAIIMDGNGRWATQRGKVRITGHQAGAESVRAVTRYCGQVGVQTLTLFAFSTENWKRPKAEVAFLFRLLKRYLVNERPELAANNVRLTSIGRVSALPADIQAELRRSEELTASNPGLNLCLALNYGAQDELLDAAKALVAQAARGELAPEAITEERLGQALFTAGMPPVDLLIRTAGERRLSNFLLWQVRHAAFHVSPVCWPDFGAEDLKAALVAFAKN